MYKVGGFIIQWYYIVAAAVVLSLICCLIGYGVGSANANSERRGGFESTNDEQEGEECDFRGERVGGEEGGYYYDSDEDEERAHGGGSNHAVVHSPPPSRSQPQAQQPQHKPQQNPQLTPRESEDSGASSPSKANTSAAVRGRRASEDIRQRHAEYAKSAALSISFKRGNAHKSDDASVELSTAGVAQHKPFSAVNDSSTSQIPPKPPRIGSDTPQGVSASSPLAGPPPSTPPPPPPPLAKSSSSKKQRNDSTFAGVNPMSASKSSKQKSSKSIASPSSQQERETTTPQSAKSPSPQKKKSKYTPEADAAPLPGGWEEKFSKKHDRKYWKHKETGEVTWKRPKA